jgi:hypothetical protein
LYNNKKIKHLKRQKKNYELLLTGYRIAGKGETQPESPGLEENKEKCGCAQTGQRTSFIL